MIKLDIQRYIRNRMWFGWWYYPHKSQGSTTTWPNWQRDLRYRHTAVILVRKTYDSKGRSGLNKYYDKV